MDGSTPQLDQTSAQPPLDSLVSFVVTLLESLERQGVLTSAALSVSSVQDLRHTVEGALALAARGSGDRRARDTFASPTAATPAPGPGPDPVPPLAGPLNERPPGPGSDARQQLFDALVGDVALPAEALDKLAASIGWSCLPQQIQPVALSPEASTARLPLSSHILASTGSREPCFLVLDPARHKAFSLRALLGEQTAAVGLTVDPAETGASLRWARSLVYFHRVQHGQRGGLVHVKDHLSTLMLIQDEFLSKAHSEHWLRPMKGLTQRQSERLGDTLLAWLDGRCASEAAKILDVHPQTIRYRLRQIEKLFGSTLYDPRGRFELKLALHSRLMMAGSRFENPRAPEPRGSRNTASPHALRSNGLI